MTARLISRMATTINSGAACPCGSGRPFGACCEPLLSGQRTAATPRELMRSRYTAHYLGNEAYLHRTWAKTAGRKFTPPRAQAAPTSWTRLVIHGDEPGASPDVGYVEFSAFHRDARGEHEMRERSEFRRVNGQWLYVAARE